MSSSDSWYLTSEEGFKVSKNRISSASCSRKRLRGFDDSINNLHLSQSESIQATSSGNDKVFDSTFSFQVLNNLGVNQKVCNDSSKRNDSTIFHSEGISGIPHSIPHVIEDYVDNINLLLSGNAIQNVFLLIIDEICSMC